MEDEHDRGLETDILATTLKEGIEESQDLLDFLALKFEGPLSQLMSVRRKGGLFSKRHPVEEITLRFNERHFRIARDSRGIVTSKISKEVRGIVVKTNVVEIKEWISELALELSREAERSTALRSALSKFMLG